METNTSWLSTYAWRRFFKTLQSLSCFHFMIVFLGFNFGLLFFSFYLLFTKWFFLPLAYAAWIYLDRETPRLGGRRSNWIRTCRIWRWMADYFPITLHKTVDLDPSRNYLFAFHPHGIFGIGGFINFASEGTGFAEKFPGITNHLLILEGHFLFPLYRDYVLLSGAGCSSLESIKHKLTKLGPGNSVWLAIGGAAEAFLSTPDNYGLKILPRKGFVKAAMATGSPLVPVFSFGENQIFDQVRPPTGTFLYRAQEEARKWLGFAPVVFRGRLINPIMPFRKPINTVVGAPIEVPKIENPTKEEVDKWHGIYLDKLRELFDENKAKFGDEGKELVFH